jgi:hypothetical protein
MSFLLLASLLCAAADDVPLRATLVEGEVTRNGAPLAEGDALHEGETVQTGAGARAEISTTAGSVVRLGESSKMTLGSAAGGKVFSARLFLGNLWAKVHKLVAGESFQVETENAVAGVRGTEFRVEVAPGKEDLVRVYEGAVEVKSHIGAWMHRLESGKELLFLRDRAAAPRAFDAATESQHKFMKWVRSRPVREGLERLRHRERRRLRDRTR